MSAKYVFIQEDASTPSLAPLYRGPYLVLGRREKYFCLKIGTRTDVVSVNPLKPFFSDDPVLPALLPTREGPALQVLVPILHPPVVLDPPSAAHPVRPGWKVCFQLPPSVPACWNPRRAV